MTVWYVHRRSDNSIASAHAEIQPGYAEEALDDVKDADMAAFRAAATAKPPATVADKLARIGLTTADLKQALA